MIETTQGLGLQGVKNSNDCVWSVIFMLIIESPLGLTNYHYYSYKK